MRHAKSDWNGNYSIDFERHLNKRGRKASATMASRLILNNSLPDKVLISSAQRTRETAQIMIKNGADHWDWGLRGACLGGHIKLTKLMVKKGANNWNWGLWGACQRGHIEIAKLITGKSKF